LVARKRRENIIRYREARVRRTIKDTVRRTRARTDKNEIVGDVNGDQNSIGGVVFSFSRAVPVRRT